MGVLVELLWCVSCQAVLQHLYPAMFTNSMNCLLLMAFLVHLKTPLYIIEGPLRQQAFPTVMHSWGPSYHSSPWLEISFALEAPLDPTDP
jgi:hypothetical protein